MRINTLKNRLFIGFLSTLIFLIIFGIISLYDMYSMYRLGRIATEFKEIKSQFFEIAAADDQLSEPENLNSVFFLTGTNDVLANRDAKWNQLNQLIKDQKLHWEGKISTELIELLEFQLNEYHTIILKRRHLLHLRGFKDYGLEGDLRDAIHYLEDSENKLKLDEILTLRRIEKDFFLRKDTFYVQKFAKYAQSLQTNLVKNQADSLTLSLLKTYIELFDKISLVQEQLGIDAESGIRGEMANCKSILAQTFKTMDSNLEKKLESINQRVFIIFIIAFILTIVVSVYWGRWISKRLSSPIKRLNTIVLESAENGMLSSKEGLNFASDEIQNLAKSLFHLIRVSKTQLTELKDQSRQMEEQNKELQKLNQELDAFLYSTTHDLRAPLSSVLGLINVAKIDPDKEKLLDYFTKIETSTLKMDKFIKDVLAYSKNQKSELEYETIDIAKTLNPILTEAYYLSANQIVDFKINNNGPKEIYHDSIRFQIILNNLISNAFKYCDPTKENSKVILSIDQHNNYHQISCWDNGIGIQQEYIDRVFNMFFRATERSMGSGLGLFILMESVKKLGGEVQVESDYGKWTEFIVRIPMVRKNQKLSLESDFIK